MNEIDISMEDIILESNDTGQSDNQQDTNVPNSTQNSDTQENTIDKDPLETSFDVPILIEQSEKTLPKRNVDLDESGSDPFDSSTDEILPDVGRAPVTR